MSSLLVYGATILVRDRRNQGQGRQVKPAGTMPRGRELNGKKGNILVRIEPFQLERWMTKYEVNVKWDIAESGIYPMSVREILDLLPPEERETRTGPIARSAAGIQRSVRQRGAAWPDRGHLREHLAGRNSRHHRRHRSEFPALQRAAFGGGPDRGRQSGLPATPQRRQSDWLRSRPLEAPR